MDDQTEVEIETVKIIQQRNEKGCITYGKGLDHNDPQYDWIDMAIEEAADLFKYLVAQKLRMNTKVSNIKVDNIAIKNVKVKKLIIKKCYDCPKCVFYNGWGWYCKGINLPSVRENKIENPKEIPDWCELEDIV